MKKQTPQIKSIFEQISHQVFTMKNVVEAKQFITEFVNDKKINDTDKANIIKNVKEVKIYRVYGETQGAALQQATEQAKNPIRRYEYVRKVKTLTGNDYEVLVAVPIFAPVK